MLDFGFVPSKTLSCLYMLSNGQVPEPHGLLQSGGRISSALLHIDFIIWRRESWVGQASTSFLE